MEEESYVGGEGLKGWVGEEALEEKLGRVGAGNKEGKVEVEH